MTPRVEQTLTGAVLFAFACLCGTTAANVCWLVSQGHLAPDLVQKAAGSVGIVVAWWRGEA